MACWYPEQVSNLCELRWITTPMWKVCACCAVLLKHIYIYILKCVVVASYRGSTTMTYRGHIVPYGRCAYWPECRRVFHFRCSVGCRNPLCKQHWETGINLGRCGMYCARRPRPREWGPAIPLARRNRWTWGSRDEHTHIYTHMPTFEPTTNKTTTKSFRTGAVRTNT